MDLIAVEGLKHAYRIGSMRVPALYGIDFAIPEGQMAAIMGPSGSGKSTLLHILGCLMQPEGGSYRLAGKDVTRLPGDALSRVRNHEIGFVFQAYNLIPQLTALENVELPLIYRGVSTQARRKLAAAMLDEVGLADRLSHRPMELSGGQQQRIGIARAMVTDPAMILADEPTGNLDSTSGEAILNLFATLNARGRTIVLVTHDEDVAARCTRTIRIRDGKVADDAPRTRRVANGPAR